MFLGQEGEIILVGGKHKTGITARIKSKRNPCATCYSQFALAKQTVGQEAAKD